MGQARFVFSYALTLEQSFQRIDVSLSQACFKEMELEFSFTFRLPEHITTCVMEDSVDQKCIVEVLPATSSHCLLAVNKSAACVSP